MPGIAMLVTGAVGIYLLANGFASTSDSAGNGRIVFVNDNGKVASIHRTGEGEKALIKNLYTSGWSGEAEAQGVARTHSTGKNYAVFHNRSNCTISTFEIASGKKVASYDFCGYVSEKKDVVVDAITVEPELGADGLPMLTVAATGGDKEKTPFIYKATADGSKIFGLVAYPKPYEGIDKLEWNADGSRLFYQARNINERDPSMRGYGEAVYVYDEGIRAGGPSVKKIAQNAYNMSFALSANDKKLAICHNGNRITTIDTDGSNEKVLYRWQDEKKSDTFFDCGEDGKSNLEINATGNKVYFVNYESAPDAKPIRPGSGDVYKYKVSHIIEIDAGTLKTKQLASAYYIKDIQFGQNGERLAYTSYNNKKNRAEIYQMLSDGTDNTLVTSGKVNDQNRAMLFTW